MRFKRHSDLKIKNFHKAGKNRWKIKLLMSNMKKDSRLLDIGCAAGNISNFVANKEKYYGVDYNEDFVEFGNKKGIKISFCDLSKGKLPFEDNFFDTIWFSHVIEHLHAKEQVAIFNDIYRILKPGGKVIVFAPTPYHWFFWDNNTHVKPCTHGQLESLAQDCGFSIAKGRYSLIRWLPYKFQRLARVTPLRFFLWETFLIAKK